MKNIIIEINAEISTRGTDNVPISYFPSANFELKFLQLVSILQSKLAGGRAGTIPLSLLEKFLQPRQKQEFWPAVAQKNCSFYG